MEAHMEAHRVRKRMARPFFQASRPVLVAPEYPENPERPTQGK